MRTFVALLLCLGISTAALALEGSQVVRWYCLTEKAHLEHWHVGAAGFFPQAAQNLKGLLKRGECVKVDPTEVTPLERLAFTPAGDPNWRYEAWKVQIPNGSVVYTVFHVRTEQTSFLNI